MATHKSVWREGTWGNETVVRCCGCGSRIAVAESRWRYIRPDVEGDESAVHSCSPECERDYDERVDARKT